jgi:hypothetical protein
MRKLLTVLLLTLALSCSKGDKDDEPEKVICPEPTFPSWILETLNRLSSCDCETAFLIGTYNNKVVIEQRLQDQLCDGYDIVYNNDGSVLFTSKNVADWKKYREGVTGLREIWRCSRPAK